MLTQTLAGNPAVNQRTLTAEYLIVHGKGRELDRWMVPEQPPRPAEPEPPKSSVSVSTKLEMLPPEAQQAILQGAGLLPPGPPVQGQGPAGGPSFPPPEPAPNQGPPMAPPPSMPEIPRDERPGEGGVSLPGLPGIPASQFMIPGDEQ
jgi:hypothetical protein